jgi:hypothetical protein
MSNYVSGSCNIGSQEIHRRYQVAILGAVLYLVMAAAFIFGDIPSSLKITIFIPAMMASVGFIQARKKFCLAYGLMGVFSFEKAGATTSIKDPVALAADRAYAINVLLQSLIPATAMTLIFLFA